MRLAAGDGALLALATVCAGLPPGMPKPLGAAPAAVPLMGDVGIVPRGARIGVPVEFALTLTSEVLSGRHFDSSDSSRENTILFFSKKTN